MALSKPRPILKDMPPHIKEKIFNKLDYFLYKMWLQKAFPEFRRVIGTPDFPYFQFCLVCSADHNKIQLEANGRGETFIRSYTQAENGTTMGHSFWSEPEYKRFIPETEGNHIDLLVEMFECMVDNPKFELEELMIDSGVRSADTEEASRNRQEFLEKLGNVLENLKRKIKVHTFLMDFGGKQDNLLKILPYIDPDHLKHLMMNCFEKVIDGVDKLVELEQWKKVEELYMFDLPDNKFPIENWWNIPKTLMKLKYTSLKDIQRLVQHFRRSETFVNCYLNTEFQQDQLKDALGKNRVLVPHPTRAGESYVEIPATETLKRIFVCFPDLEGRVDIATQLESEISSDED